MTPEEQSRELLILLDSYHQYDGPTRLKKSERAIAAALSQVDAQWKNTLAEMEACYLKREGDIHARIEQARKEERAVMKRARDLLRDFFGEVGLREEDAFAHLAHDLLSARAQESEG